MVVPPLLKDPVGVIERLRLGEVPTEGLGWLLTGHDAELAEVADRLQRLADGKSPQPFQFIEGPPGSGKSALLNRIRGMAEERGFAVCSLDVTSKRGPFTEQRYLVAKVLREIQAKSTDGYGDLDKILQRFSKSILTDFKKDDTETVNQTSERLRKFLGDRLSKYMIPEKSVIDAALSYIYGFIKEDPFRMRKVIEWFLGENLTTTEIRNIVGAETRLDEHTALPILKSVIPLLQEAGHPGLILLVDEMVQSTLEHHETQRQRTQELVRTLYAGVIPRCLVFVGVTPETIMDSDRGFAAHEGMRSRVGDGAVPDRDPDLPRYRVGKLSRGEAKVVFLHILAVYEKAYRLPRGWLDGGGTDLMNKLLPEGDTLARAFVQGTVRAFDAARRGTI